MKSKTVILALLVVIGSVIGPAWNLTVAEIADKYDDSLTTKFQPELLISAWGSAIAAVAGGIVIYLTRNQPPKP